MASFLKEFLLDDPKRLDGSGRAAILAGFGKHPAWKDHDVKIGLTTQSLIKTWDAVYEEGIGGRGGPISSAENSWEDWEKQHPGELLPGFNHVFVWWRSGQFLIGRLWASSDHALPPRTQYPFVACLQMAGLPLPWSIRQLGPRLDEIAEFCKLRTPEEIDAAVRQCRNNEVERDQVRARVQAGFDGLQQRLREWIATVPATELSRLTPDERQEFVNMAGSGSDREGLLRVLHQIHSNFVGYLGRKSLTRGDDSSLRSAQVRVPVAALSSIEGILRWIEFFNFILAPDTPMLLIAPMGGEWIDVTVGEPRADQFFCLRATLKAVPMASSIPFALEPSLREKGTQIIAAFLADQRLPAEPATEVKEPGAKFFRRVTPKTESTMTSEASLGAAPGSSPRPTGPAEQVHPEHSNPAAPGDRGKRWWIGGLVGAAVLASLFYFSMGDLLPHARNVSPSTSSPTVVVKVPIEDSFVREFNAAQAAERAGSYNKALAGYEAAASLKPGDSVTREKIEAMRQLINRAAASAKYAAALREASNEWRRAENAFGLKQFEVALTNIELSLLSATAGRAPWDPGQADQLRAVIELRRTEIGNAAKENARRQQSEVALQAATSAWERAETARKSGRYDEALTNLTVARLKCVEARASGETLPVQKLEGLLDSSEKAVLAAKEQKFRANQYWTALRDATNAWNAARTLVGEKNHRDAVGQFDRALEFCKQAQSVSSGPDAQALRAALTPSRNAAAVEWRFAEALKTARAADQSKDVRAALKGYEEALKIKPEEPECVAKIQYLRRALEGMTAVEASLAEARHAEQANNSGAALAAYRNVLKLNPDHAEATSAVARLAKAATASTGNSDSSAPTSTVQRTSASVGTDTNSLEQLDTTLEVLLVQFGVWRARDLRIRSAEARKASSVGFLSRPERQHYLHVAERLETEFAKGGWLEAHDRAQNLKKLKIAIKRY